MKRLAWLLASACLLCAQTQSSEFTVAIESLGGGEVAVSFNTQDPVVGFVGYFEYQAAPGEAWKSETIFARHSYRTGGRLVLSCGGCVGTYVTVQEITGFGSSAVAFGGGE
jgi:hypothetical protein